jgi:hypothetical protein
MQLHKNFKHFLLQMQIVIQLLFIKPEISLLHIKALFYALVLFLKMLFP